MCLDSGDHDCPRTTSGDVIQIPKQIGCKYKHRSADTAGRWTAMPRLDRTGHKNSNTPSDKLTCSEPLLATLPRPRIQSFLTTWEESTRRPNRPFTSISTSAMSPPHFWLINCNKKQAQSIQQQLFIPSLKTHIVFLPPPRPTPQFCMAVPLVVYPWRMSLLVQDFGGVHECTSPSRHASVVH